MTILSLALWCGVLAGPLFILVFLLEGFLRAGYNPLRQPVSALSHGPRGWVQQANFFINGILLVAYAWGLFTLPSLNSLWGPLFIFFYGAGLVGAGMFITDFGRRTLGPSPTRTAGILHEIFSAIVFISLTLACFIFAHFFYSISLPYWAIYSALTGVLYFTGFVVFARGFDRSSTLASIAGLVQRLTISVGAVWVTLVALHFLFT